MHERARDYKKDFQRYSKNHRDAKREQVEMDNFQTPEVRLLFWLYELTRPVAF